MKNIKKIMLVILIIVSSILPRYIYAEDVNYFIDENELLTSEEIDKLNEKAKKYSEEKGIDIAAILSKNCENMNTIKYAKEQFQEADFENPTILLVYNEEMAEYHYHLSDELKDEYTQEFLDELWEKISSKEDAYSAMQVYLDGIANMKDADDAEVKDEEMSVFLIDDANFLSDEEEEKLNSKLEDISLNQKCDVIILTVEDLQEKETMTYAKEYFEENDYGQGSDKDGIIFLLSSDKKWALFTNGFASKALTQENNKNIEKEIAPFFKEENYFEGFEKFADMSQQYLSEARSSNEDKSSDDSKKPFNPLFFVGGILGGFLISFLIMYSLKSSLKTVQYSRTADNYIKNSSMKLRYSDDKYINKYVDKTPKNESTNKKSSKNQGGSSGQF